MNPFPKLCPCCSAVYSAKTWAELPLVGEKALTDGEPVLSYRNCPCGSTLAIELPADDIDQEAA